jgi:hypothetical protein
VNAIAPDKAGGAFFVSSVVDLPVTAGAQSPNTGGGAVVKIVPGMYPTSVRSSLNPAVVGQNVTLVADVQNTQPGGTVNFYDAGALIGAVSPAAGRATLDVALAPGIHKITVMHSADGATSLPLFQLVKAQ